jgi:hypothetical protein
MDAADLLGDSRSRGGDSRPFGEDRRTGGRMLPLYAAPLPVNRQFVPFGTEPVGRIPCVFILLDVPDAFAAAVPNNASAPRYFSGETICVNPAATPATGDFVWLRRSGGDVAIARLAEVGVDSFRLEFLGLEGDERTAEIGFEDVLTINKIVASVT